MKKPIKFGGWLVDENGNLSNESESIIITNDRLIEKDWFHYFRSFKKFNWNHFFPAFLEACERSKIKEITFKI